MARREAPPPQYTSNPPLISAEGDCAIRVQFGEGIDPETNRRVHGFCRAVRDAAIAGVVEWTPAYCVATVYYDPCVIGYEGLRKQLSALVSNNSEQPIDSSVIEIPAVYGREYGPDLAEVAARCDLSEEVVIALHSGRDYLCYMIGFTPGFPYLGELPKKLRLPRRETPRVRVPPGSVAIADAQTGIYPKESPGGWHLIGRTPFPLFDPTADPPIIVQPGDMVRFVSINASEFAAIEDKIRRGEYTLKRVAHEG